MALDAPKPSLSPWTVPSALSPPSSLADVMSEELAIKLQKEEEEAVATANIRTASSEVQVTPAIDLFDVTDQHPDYQENHIADTNDDYILAQMLQHEFDKEHDKMLKKEEEAYNKSSKVKLSFENYRSLHPALLYNDDDDDSGDDDSEEDEDWKVRHLPTNRKGYTGKGKDITTKHDPLICGRKNASKVMEFPPSFASGDSRPGDLQLSNSVYNVLKVHSWAEEKKSHRVHEKKEHSTFEQALDSNTRLLLYKIVNAGILENVNGCVSTGKEAVIFHADGGKLEAQVVPRECAVKVFKTTLNEFKNRDKYIKDDYRFKDRFSKQNPRKVIRMWAEKEWHNLTRMREAGIKCPDVVLLRKHILVMSFIGEDHKPAPKLKEVTLSRQQMQSAYEQCLKMMESLYRDCRLVHADLSEYNMLWWRDCLWLIDVSQSIEPNHPHATDLLLRDCTNVSKFFSKRGVVDVLQPYEIFNKITGLSIEGKDGQILLDKAQAYEENEDLLAFGKSGNDYAFEYLLQQAQKQENSIDRDISTKDSHGTISTESIGGKSD